MKPFSKSYSNMFSLLHKSLIKFVSDHAHYREEKWQMPLGLRRRKKPVNNKWRETLKEAYSPTAKEKLSLSPEQILFTQASRSRFRYTEWDGKMTGLALNMFCLFPYLARSDKSG